MTLTVKEVIKSKTNEAWSYIVFEATRDENDVVHLPDNRPIMTSVAEGLNLKTGDKVAV